jgi:hypothetical protein
VVLELAREGFSTEDGVLHIDFHTLTPELSTGLSTLGIITPV